MKVESQGKVVMRSMKSCGGSCLWVEWKLRIAMKLTSEVPYVRVEAELTEVRGPVARRRFKQLSLHSEATT